MENKEVIKISKKETSGVPAKVAVRNWMNSRNFGSFTNDQGIVIDWVRFDKDGNSETIIDSIEEEAEDYKVTLKAGSHYEPVDDYSENKDDFDAIPGIDF